MIVTGVLRSGRDGFQLTFQQPRITVGDPDAAGFRGRLGGGGGAVVAATAAPVRRLGRRDGTVPAPRPAPGA